MTKNDEKDEIFFYKLICLYTAMCLFFQGFYTRAFEICLSI